MTGEELKNIRAAVAGGRLSIGALEAAVEAALAEELRKPDTAIDAAFVEACHAILWDIHQARYPDINPREGPRLAQILEAARGRRASAPKRRSFALRAAALVPVVIIGMFVGDVLLGDSRLTVEQSEDEQQLIIQVMPEASGMLDTGAAEGGWGDSVADGDVIYFDSYDGAFVDAPPEGGPVPPPGNEPPPRPAGDFTNVTTTDLSVVLSVLGAYPPMPSWAPEGWSLTEYHATRFGEDISFRSVFETPGQQYILMYCYDRYGSDTSASVAYEQDGAGEWVTTPGGRQVYKTTNYDISVVIWKSPSTTQSLSGPVPHDVLMQMVDSVH